MTYARRHLGSSPSLACVPPTNSLERVWPRHLPSLFRRMVANHAGTVRRRRHVLRAKCRSTSVMARRRKASCERQPQATGRTEWRVGGDPTVGPASETVGHAPAAGSRCFEAPKCLIQEGIDQHDRNSASHSGRATERAGAPSPAALCVSRLRSFVLRVRVEHPVMQGARRRRIGDRPPQRNAATFDLDAVLARREREGPSGAATPLPEAEANQVQVSDDGVAGDVKIDVRERADGVAATVRGELMGTAPAIEWVGMCAVPPGNRDGFLRAR